MASIFGKAAPVLQPANSFSQAASGLGALQSFAASIKSTGIRGGSRGGLGRSALGDVLSRGDPVLAYEWEGMIIDPGNPEPIPYVYIESIQAPNIQFEQDFRYFQGRNLSYPARIVTDSLTIQLYNDYTGAAAALAASWCEETFVTESGGFRLPAEFKKSVRVNIYDAKHNQVYAMLFGGCYPTSIGHASSLDYKSSEPNSIVLTLSVDYVFLGA